MIEILDIAFTWKALLFFVLAQIFLILSGFLTHIEIAEVNRKLPDDQQISYFFSAPGKMARIKRQYKELYPAGRIDLVRVILGSLGMIFAVATAWELHRSGLP